MEKPKLIIKISALDKMKGQGPSKMGMKPMMEDEEYGSSKMLAMHPVSKMSDEELTLVHDAACEEMKKRGLDDDAMDSEEDEAY